MSIPISCKCITYGRVEYLEESIHSFLKQDYDGERELIIVNDYPLQKLEFDHPLVKVINLDKTFSTIGEKENFAVSQCKYDTIAVWDDDDFAEPWHLQNINTYFPGHDLLHWNKGIALVSNKIAALGNIGNSGIIYSKQIWEKVGKHEPENAGYDMTFVRKIEKAGGKVARVKPKDNRVSWLYSWGGGSYHMSGQGKDVPARENVLIRHSRHIEQLRQQGKIPTGEVVLNPHWKHDYEQMLIDYNKKSADQQLTNPKNLNGWAIGEEVLDWLLSRVPKGSTILEFGSGRGTIELSRFYDVISIEHNPRWIGLSKTAKYVHAPLVEGWYDVNPIKEAIEGRDIKVIIVDGPPGAGNREGFIKNFHLFSRTSSIVVDDTHRPQELALAQKISKLVHRKNITITGHEKKFDVI